jgi:hypothetical protein
MIFKKPIVTMGSKHFLNTFTSVRISSGKAVAKEQKRVQAVI